jgi:hypothetical protein
VVGDWWGTGEDTVGLYDPYASWDATGEAPHFYLAKSNDTPNEYHGIWLESYIPPYMLPVVGNWFGMANGVSGVVSEAKSVSRVRALPTHDVDRNGAVTPGDVLLIVNYLNTQPADVDSPPMAYDVDHDGHVVPRDVLLIVNHLNRPDESDTAPTLDTGVRAWSAVGAEFIAANPSAYPVTPTTAPNSQVADHSSAGSTLFAFAAGEAESSRPATETAPLRASDPGLAREEFFADYDPLFLGIEETLAELMIPERRINV